MSTAAYHTVAAFLPFMKGKGGRIAIPPHGGAIGMFGCLRNPLRSRGLAECPERARQFKIAVSVSATEVDTPIGIEEAKTLPPRRAP